MAELKVRGGETLYCGFLDLAQVTACIELACDSFRVDQDIVTDWFSKRLLNNPYQRDIKGFGVGIRGGSGLVAFRAMLGQPWWIEGRETVIAFASHTCVRNEYRGRGLAREMIRKSQDCGILSGSTTAGEQTQPIYNDCGYRSIGDDSPFFHRRLSYRNSLVKRLGRTVGCGIAPLCDCALWRPRWDGAGADSFTFSVLNRCDERFDRLWESARKGYASCLERSSSYLNWRLFEQPTSPLHLGGLFDRKGRLRAFAVWHQASFDDHTKMAGLRDLFAGKDDHAAIRSLLERLSGHWRDAGISWASFEVAHPQITEIFSSSGFTRLPAKGNRYFIHAKAPVAESTWRDWFRSGLDGDFADLRDPRHF
jgi:hypothetical protein